jgi:tetrahydromethanopterin S-methyltransferase subunit B
MTGEVIDKMQEFENKLDKLLTALNPQKPSNNQSISSEEEQYLNQIVHRFFYER